MKRKIYTLFRAALALCLMFCLTLPVFAGGADPAAGGIPRSIASRNAVGSGYSVRPRRLRVARAAAKRSRWTTGSISSP